MISAGRMGEDDPPGITAFSVVGPPAGLSMSRLPPSAATRWPMPARPEPGARTAWHTHPLGQTLIVTQGRGWLQEWGKAAEILNQGDIAWIPPGVKHWHGASAQTAMTHLAIAEAVNGSPVTWLEKVTDEQYPNG